MANFMNDSIGGAGAFAAGGPGFGGWSGIPYPFPVGNYGGDGLNGITGLAAIALLAGGGFGNWNRGGHHDHGCPRDCGDVNSSAAVAAILAGVNNLSTAVPTAALETQGTINTAIGSLALGTQQGLSDVKDSVQVAGAANLAAICNVERSVLTSTASLLSAVKDSQYATAVAVRDDGDKTRAQMALYHEANLQRQLGVAEAALAEERSSRRIRDVEVSINQTQTNTQVQAQAQAQQQQQAQFLAGILAEIRNLAGDIQAVKQGQVIFNSGTMAASGTQAAANTKVA